MSSDSTGAVSSTERSDRCYGVVATVQCEIDASLEREVARARARIEGPEEDNTPVAALSPQPGAGENVTATESFLSGKQVLVHGGFPVYDSEDVKSMVELFEGKATTRFSKNATEDNEQTKIDAAIERGVEHITLAGALTRLKKTSYGRS